MERLQVDTTAIAYAMVSLVRKPLEVYFAVRMYIQYERKDVPLAVRVSRVGCGRVVMRSVARAKEA